MADETPKKIPGVADLSALNEPARTFNVADINSPLNDVIIDWSALDALMKLPGMPPDPSIRRSYNCRSQLPDKFYDFLEGFYDFPEGFYDFLEGFYDFLEGFLEEVQHQVQFYWNRHFLYQGNTRKVEFSTGLIRTLLNSMINGTEVPKPFDGMDEVPGVKTYLRDVVSKIATDAPPPSDHIQVTFIGGKNAGKYISMASDVKRFQLPIGYGQIETYEIGMMRCPNRRGGYEDIPVAFLATSNEAATFRELLETYRQNSNTPQPQPASSWKTKVDTNNLKKDVEALQVKTEAVLRMLTQGYNQRTKREKKAAQRVEAALHQIEQVLLTAKTLEVDLQ